MKNKIKKILCCFLILTVLSNLSNAVIAAENSSYSGIVNVGDKLWITLYKEYSDENRKYTGEDFPGLDIYEIKPMYNSTTQEMELIITLYKSKVEDVYAAIETLQENPMVKSLITIRGTEVDTEEKQYYSGTLEDIETEDYIIVTIFHRYSGLDKEFSVEDFPGIEIESIEYLTPLLDPNKDYPMLNIEGYNQILGIVIANKGKENVLEAIRILEENPIVKSALPDGTDAIADEIIPIPDIDMKMDGDVNGDKLLNAEDALLILKHAAKISEIVSESLLHVDINPDGIINADDALMVLKIAAKIGI